MKYGICRVLAVAIILICAAGAYCGPKQFTYQALLTDGAGQPITSANTSVTLCLYNAPTAGTFLQKQDFSALNLSTSGGYVSLPVNSTSLDLSGDVYVEVTVRDVAAAGTPQTLTPRQKLTSTPFALQANTLAPAFPWPNRTLFVNPGTVTASANPTGSLADPFNSIQAAFTKAKTMAPSYANRVVVMLMPGSHTVSSTVVIDSQGIDIIGFGEKSAVVTGSADPLLSATVVGGAGATIRNLILQTPLNGSNRALGMRDGRVENVIINRAGTPITGYLVDVYAVGDLSFKDVDIAGSVNVGWYGASTTFNGGYISGTVTSTGYSPTGGGLVFMNLSSIAQINFTPPVDGGALPTGVVSAPKTGTLALGNVQVVAGLTINANTIITAQNTSFVNQGRMPVVISDPAAGSGLINCFGDASSWTGVSKASSGNVSGSYSALLVK